MVLPVAENGDLFIGKSISNVLQWIALLFRT